jgi:hypothetical protein
MELGACNAECSGYYEKKRILITNNLYSSDLGGISGADAKCEDELGSGWKALIVGGSRRATTTPFLGDGSDEWVVHKWVHYYNWNDELIWRTDEVPLLGVRGGKRLNVYADAHGNFGSYTWSGWDTDWTTLEDAGYEGTCAGWTSTSAGSGSFSGPDLLPAASEPCGSSLFLLCVEQ